MPGYTAGSRRVLLQGAIWMGNMDGHQELLFRLLQAMISDTDKFVPAALSYLLTCRILHAAMGHRGMYRENITYGSTHGRFTYPQFQYHRTH